jgi:hypothetical protein
MAQEKESKTNWHFRISIIKSLFRIVAGLLLITSDIMTAGLILIAAELLGIIEEF